MAGASMEKIIKAAVERGASDLHIKAGDVFRARIDGNLVPLTKQRLTPDQTRAIAQRLVGGEDSAKQLEGLRDFDCSWGLPGVGRFRINILRQRSSYMIVMRVIPFTVPSLESLALPVSLQAVAESDRGLVLVAGMSGSGKSSTVAALVNHINQQQQRHIVIIEDPIEFLHRDLNSSITQREVGVDTDSTEVGLRAALRQDPDVIVLGDLRDANAVNLAIKAAEAGRLVIAVMPSPGALATVGQVHAILPEDEREIGRVRFGPVCPMVEGDETVPGVPFNRELEIVGPDIPVDVSAKLPSRNMVVEGAIMLALSYLVFKSQKLIPTTGMEGLIGEVGEVRGKPR